MFVQEDQWRSLSRWYDSYLTADRVTRYLTESGESLAADFFGTNSDAVAKRWSLEEVYSFLAGRGGDERIPRLFPLTAQRGPARLLHTSHIEIPEIAADLVVHTWDPRDDRGVVAIGYPVRDSPGAQIKDTADLLLGMTGASAVAVLTGHAAPIRVGNDVSQPGLWVADGRLTHAVDSVGISTERFGWCDLNNLLQTSLPYWPCGLRDRDAMLAWRPGDGPREVTFGFHDCYPRTLAKAIPDSSPIVQDIVDRVVHRAESFLIEISDADRDRYGVGGLNFAAVPAYPGGDSYVSDGEATLLLHQRAPDPQLVTSLLVEAIPAVAVAHGTKVVDPTGPLAEAWLARLKPAPAPPELGFWLLYRPLKGWEGPGEFLVHPGLPDCWIARRDGTVAHTVGTRVPATGTLVHAYVTDAGGFFRDSSGAIWPVPAPISPGDDPQVALARTLTILSADAGADVNDSTYVVNPSILDCVCAGFPVDYTAAADDPGQSASDAMRGTVR